MALKFVKQIIFDADDTLWENNIFYIRAAESLLDIITGFGFERKAIENQFQTLERQVVRERGYGSGNFIYILRTLFDRYKPSDNQARTNEIFGKICTDFLNHVRNKPHIFKPVPQILDRLQSAYSLFVLTKGNISEQWKKLERSELLPYFEKAYVEPEKDLSTYHRIVRENKWKPGETCMIGNSPKSDINPALEAGCWAVYIPYAFTWVLDDEPLDKNHERLISVLGFEDLENLFL